MLDQMGLELKKKKFMTPHFGLGFLKIHTDIKHIYRILLSHSFSYFILDIFLMIVELTHCLNWILYIHFIRITYDVSCFLLKKVSMISPDSLYRPILNLSKTCNSKEQVFRSLLCTLTAALSCHQVVVFELHCKSL